MVCMPASHVDVCVRVGVCVCETTHQCTLSVTVHVSVTCTRVQVSSDFVLVTRNLLCEPVNCAIC